MGCSFSPFIIDTYGCLAPAALKLIKDIQGESITSFGPPAPFHLSRTAFLARLSSLWQLGNAKIVMQWLTMMRAAHRTIRQAANTGVTFSTLTFSTLADDPSLVPPADDSPGTDAAPAR